MARWQKVGRLAAAVAAVAFLGACGPGRDAPRVDLADREEVAPPPPAPEKRHALRVALGGMITPREGLAYYLAFLKGLESRIGLPLEYVDREDYGEINALLRAGEVDFAFVCSGPYVDGHDQWGLELVAAPVAYGETVYHSYIIVPEASAVRTFGQLRGRSFAFSDPLSNTGSLVPTYLLARMGETKERFFGEFVYTHAHDKSIHAVAEGLVDGAAVDSLIWEYENRTDPRFTSRTRIVEKSPPYGIPPVVVTPGLAADLKERIRRAFLEADRDAGLQEAMRGMMIDRFVPVEDSHYDSVREMKRWLEDRPGGEPPPAPRSP